MSRIFISEDLDSNYLNVLFVEVFLTNVSLKNPIQFLLYLQIHLAANV
jgi:hypothetical protein